eukprot:Selendium_serpulae@DN3828_c0_g1_i1.p1
MILSAGAAVGSSERMVFDGAFIVLGDLNVLFVPDGVVNPQLETASTDFFLGPGVLNGAGFMLAGELILTTNPLVFNINMGVTYLSDDAYATYFTGASGAAPELLSAQRVAEIRESFDAHLCSAFHQILEAPTTGVFDLSAARLYLDCDPSGDAVGGACLITIDADTLRAATGLFLTLNDFDAMIVRVTGDGAQTFNVLPCSGCSENLLFVGIEASIITVNVEPNFRVFPLFAPVASSVQYLWTAEVAELSESSIITNSKSTLFMNPNLLFEKMINPFDLPVLGQKVFFCNCACRPDDLREKTEEKECVRTMYYY